MTKNIIILTDYKGLFESKQRSAIYRGGMDLDFLESIFNSKGWELEICTFFDIDYIKQKTNDPIILYTSSEDRNGLYKSYIEDIILHLETLGFKVLPRYRYLKAHNNKVSMELLRSESGFDEIKTITSYHFGTNEELKKNLQFFKYPVIIKKASGAMSRGVEKATSPNDLKRKARKISRSFDIRYDIKDLLRKFKYQKQYIKDSYRRSKFVTQNYIENLTNDWKVLVYGDQCYILYRENRKNDFRASGSGRFEFRKDIPSGILDYALKIKQSFNVPLISLDIGYDKERFHLIEFQFLYFGTTTLEKAPFYYELHNQSWVLIEETSTLENVYANSIIEFFENQLD